MKYVRFIYPVLVLLVIINSSCNENVAPVVKANAKNIDSLLQVYPDSVPLLLLRGNLKLDDLNFKDALADAAKAFRLDSMNLDARMLYAQVQNNKPERSVADVAIAQRHFKYIVSKQPKNTDALVQLATTYGFQRDFENAFLYVDRALRIDPRKRDAYVFKGSMFLVMERVDLAKSSYETAIQQDPKFFEGYLRLGSIYESERDPICLEYYTTAHKLEPKNPDGVYALAFANQTLGNYENAKEHYRKMIKDGSNDYYVSRGLFQIGYIQQFFDNNLDSAIYYYNSATETDGAYVEAFHNLGLCFEEKGDTEFALKNYSKALKLNPEFKLSKDAVEKYRSKYEF
jgi:tetratricopeptide (TPR) repeat protein